MDYQKPVKYNEDLIKFISSIVSNLTKDKDMVNKIASDPIWEISFTHTTFNPNIGENYEILEKIGDAAMKLAFSEYLFNTFHVISESEISEYQVHYLSKVEQARMSIELGLPKYVLTPLPTTIHIHEDVLESFFGTLFLLGNTEKPGLGYVLCYNMVIYMFKDVDFEETEFDVTRTELKELLEASGLKDIHEEWVQDKGQTSGVITLGFTEDDYNQLKRAGVSINDRKMAIVRGQTRKVARKEASVIFLDKLYKLMKTKQWQDFMEEKKRPNREINMLMERAKSVAAKVGYSDLKIKISDNAKKGVYAQLIGVRSEDDRLVNLGLVSNNKIKLMKMELLEDFIRQHS